MYKLLCTFFFFCSAIAVTAQITYRDTLIKGKHGMADTSGHIFIPALYDEITPYAYSAFDFTTGSMLSSGETVFVVRTGKKYGIYDQQGKSIVACLYSEVVVDYCDGGKYRIIAIKKKGKYAFLSPEGKLITGFDYVAIDTGDFFGNEQQVIAYVRRKGSKQFKMLDKNGKIVSGKTPDSD